MKLQRYFNYGLFGIDIYIIQNKFYLFHYVVGSLVIAQIYGMRTVVAQRRKKHNTSEKKTICKDDALKAYSMNLDYVQ